MQQNQERPFDLARPLGVRGDGCPSARTDCRCHEIMFAPLDTATGHANRIKVRGFVHSLKSGDAFRTRMIYPRVSERADERASGCGAAECVANKAGD